MPSARPAAGAVPAWEGLQATSTLLLDVDELGRIVNNYKGSSCEGDRSGGKGGSPSSAVLKCLSLLCELGPFLLCAVNKGRAEGWGWAARRGCV